MSFSFAQLKQEVRRTIHGVFAVAATYQDDTMLAPVDLRVRYHSRRAAPFGDAGSDGFVEVIENIDRVIFDVEALALLPVATKRGAVVTFPEYGDLCVRLDVRDPTDGPITETWTVTR